MHCFHVHDYVHLGMLRWGIFGIGALLQYGILDFSIAAWLHLCIGHLGIGAFGNCISWSGMLHFVIVAWVIAFFFAFSHRPCCVGHLAISAIEQKCAWVCGHMALEHWGTLAIWHGGIWALEQCVMGALGHSGHAVELVLGIFALWCFCIRALGHERREA